MRARGLKPTREQLIIPKAMSRPMRARGLKLRFGLEPQSITRVAPHAGAWVETYLCNREMKTC